MAKATYQNIRKLCSSVFSRKQTLKFAPATIASCDASIQLLFSGDSTSLRAQTVETRSVYCRQPMSEKDIFINGPLNTLTRSVIQVSHSIANDTFSYPSFLFNCEIVNQFVQFSTISFGHCDCINILNY